LDEVKHAAQLAFDRWHIDDTALNDRATAILLRYPARSSAEIRDSLMRYGGFLLQNNTFVSAPHQTVQAELIRLVELGDSVDELLRLVERAVAHARRTDAARIESRRPVMPEAPPWAMRAGGPAEVEGNPRESREQAHYPA